MHVDAESGTQLRVFENGSVKPWLDKPVFGLETLSRTLLLSSSLDGSWECLQELIDRKSKSIHHSISVRQWLCSSPMFSQLSIDSLIPFTRSSTCFNQGEKTSIFSSDDCFLWCIYSARGDSIWYVLQEVDEWHLPMYRSATTVSSSYLDLSSVVLYCFEWSTKRVFRISGSSENSTKSNMIYAVAKTDCLFSCDIRDWHTMLITSISIFLLRRFVQGIVLSDGTVAKRSRQKSLVLFFHCDHWTVVFGMRSAHPLEFVERQGVRPESLTSLI